MKDKFFCEVVQENDPVIKFQIIEADALNQAVDKLKREYTNITEWAVKDLTTGFRHTCKT